MNHDVIIVGGGPAGLAFARSLAGSGLSVAIVERQPQSALAVPASDGREIALTHRSVGILSGLGAWALLDQSDIAPLTEARVLNGQSRFALSFDTGGTGEDRLGQLVPNYRLRGALFAVVQDQPGVTILAGESVASAATDRGGVRVTLASGAMLRARLLVAADSRLSAVRDMLGIGASVTRLGRSMMVARVTHEREHGGIATEWFGHGQTIAMLPLNGRLSSAVLTLPDEEMAAVAALDRVALGAEITRRYQGRLGKMTVVEGPHVYPLTITYADHFAATRAALIGDAAVGMHPVTAHGFNLGLQGQATLARLVCRAAARGGDIGGSLLLRPYEAAHRLASRPIYAATNLLVGLYSDERPPARVARHATLRVGARLPLARAAVSRFLMQR